MTLNQLKYVIEISKQNSINEAQAKMKNQNVSPDLDQTKFNQDP